MKNPLKKYEKKRDELFKNKDLDPMHQADLLFENWRKYLIKSAKKSDSRNNNEFYNKQFNF